MSGGLAALRVDISLKALAGIEERARVRLARFEAAGRARLMSGDRGLLRRNVRGVAGEQAVLLWLRDVLGDAVEIRDAADAADGPSDLEVTTAAGVLGIEVKTTTYDGWLRYGRSISAEQVWDTDAEIYVWCAGPDVSKPREIHIVGWSTTDDVRRDHSEQRFTGARDGSMRPIPVAASMHTSEPVPEYGLDDSDFDEHEWYQSAGLGKGHEADVIDDPDMSASVVRHQDARLALLTAPEWREGSEPRPGFGPSNAIVRANAPVRSLTALADWIADWTPEA